MQIDIQAVRNTNMNLLVCAEHVTAHRAVITCIFIVQDLFASPWARIVFIKK